MKIPITRALIIVLRLLFGGVLIYASIDKLLHPVLFAETIELYDVLGTKMSRWLAVWLPYLELCVGLLLIAGIWLDAASLLNLGLMTLFLIAVSQAYARGLDIDCGCFSSEGETKITAGKLVQNTALFLGSLVIWSGRHLPHWKRKAG